MPSLLDTQEYHPFKMLNFLGLFPQAILPLLLRWRCGVIRAGIPQALLDFLLRVSGPTPPLNEEMVT